MSRRQRINNILTGLLFVLVALILLVDTQEEDYQVVLFVISVVLLVKGIKMLGYYFSMARSMVGGQMILYEGIILTDLGAFLTLFAQMPRFYALLLIAAVSAFNGIISVMRAMEKKRIGTAHWRLKLSQGIVDIASAAVFLIFNYSGEMIAEVFAVNIMYGGFVHFANAFRRNRI